MKMSAIRVSLSHTTDHTAITLDRFRWGSKTFREASFKSTYNLSTRPSKSPGLVDSDDTRVVATHLSSQILSSPSPCSSAQSTFLIKAAAIFEPLQPTSADVHTD